MRKKCCCDKKGGCCFDDETCEDLTKDKCEEQGGEYQGDDIFCDDPSVDCTIPRGACCLFDESCVDNLTEEECVVDNTGEWQGEDSVCTEDLCVIPRGACCFPDGSCVSPMLEEDCIFTDGDYQGDGSECFDGLCPDVEEECENDEDCVEGQCCNCYGSDTTGACCYSIPNAEVCWMTTPLNCAIVQGDYLGDGVPCEPDWPCPGIGTRSLRMHCTCGPCPCDTDDECPEGYCCSGFDVCEECPAECIWNSDCGEGMCCEEGFCVECEEPECEFYWQCQNGQFCCSGICQWTPCVPCTTPPCEEDEHCCYPEEGWGYCEDKGVCCIELGLNTECHDPDREPPWFDCCQHYFRCESLSQAGCDSRAESWGNTPGLTLFGWNWTEWCNYQEDESHFFGGACQIYCHSEFDWSGQGSSGTVLPEGDYTEGQCED